MRMVDGILDSITHGEHSKTINRVEERKRIEAEEAEYKRMEEESAKCIAEETSFLDKLGFGMSVPLLSDKEVKLENVAAPEINYDSLTSLKDLGIDTGFLNEMKQTLKSE